jgi:hypothetical protein
MTVLDIILQWLGLHFARINRAALYRLDDQPGEATLGASRWRQAPNPIHHSDDDWRREYLVSVDRANGSNFRFHERINKQTLE